MTYRKIAKILFGERVEEREDFERILFYIGEWEGNCGNRAMQFPDAETITDYDEIDLIALQDKMEINGIEME